MHLSSIYPELYVVCLLLWGWDPVCFSVWITARASATRPAAGPPPADVLSPFSVTQVSVHRWVSFWALWSHRSIYHLQTSDTPPKLSLSTWKCKSPQLLKEWSGYSWPFSIYISESASQITHTHTHDWNSIEFICQLVKNQHFNDIESIQERDIWLHGHWFLTTLGKVYSFFHKGLSYILLDLCLIYFFATVNIFYFLIIVSDPLFLICKNAIDIFLIFLKNWFFFLRF